MGKRPYMTQLVVVKVQTRNSEGDDWGGTFFFQPNGTPLQEIPTDHPMLVQLQAGLVDVIANDVEGGIDFYTASAPRSAAPLLRLRKKPGEETPDGGEDRDDNVAP